ncbi:MULTISPECIES: TetR/AcrR family transcriptional regulator [Cryobacterium]|uniref:TetR/AcrR family transcriptional regulator n=1 Tax=Cryobacterium TaxID=69578 RepID=UPI000CD41B0C|nr:MULTISPECIES: TetR/AcrR family transcriptional regulator [Cryobacterium]POH64541.1 TetR family transcriptional regulator [Cryobacterium zongtaii]TFC46251.1 TetR family transcriptional regulator [Cryobacterium sp. TMN-39-2]
MGRTSGAPQQLVEAARSLLHDRGYSAIGVAEICERANVRKGSFYYFFPSKQALTVATLRTTWAAERGRWLELLDDEDGLRGLETLFREQAGIQLEHHVSTGSIIGCLYGNLALETGASEADLRSCLREIFDDQSQLVFSALSKAAAVGTLSMNKVTMETGRGLIAQLEGAVLLAKLYDDPSRLANLWQQMAGLLGIARS